MHDRLQAATRRAARALTLSAMMLIGCGQEVVQTPPSTPPPPVYSGPSAFYGTVGSMTSIPVEDARPLLVSGYGLVVDLPGTGSAEVPPELRSKLRTDISRGGFGSYRTGMQAITPDRLLDSDRTAVVKVEGVIPPGATSGSPFDVMVSALPHTQTTSLEGGRLYTVDLAPFGVAMGASFSKPQAEASGPMYLNPFTSDIEQSQRVELSRRAVVLSGGKATQARRLRLVLNQPHWRRSALIAQRINERFRKDRGDRNDTAVARDDSVIDLHIPSRWRSDPERFLALISNLYVQGDADFEPRQAQQLADLVAAEPQYASRVALAWEALGKQALPVIRRNYDHGNLDIRFAALSAGVHLEDDQTSQPLELIAGHSDPQVRIRAARLMVHLPDSLRVERALRALLNDVDRDVMIAAYKALDQHGNGRLIQRVAFTDENDKLRFILDVVESQHPLIYITQTNLPRVVVFNSYTGFKTPMLARIWDYKLMIKAQSRDEAAEVYYQTPDKVEGERVSIAPAVANLVLVMGRNPATNRERVGFNLPYSRVVNALYQLDQAGSLEGEILLESSPLAQLIADAMEQVPVEDRPEIGAPAEPAAPTEAAEAGSTTRPELSAPAPG